MIKSWRPITRLEGIVHAQDGEISSAEAVGWKVREKKSQTWRFSTSWRVS